jgi:hypothetical protein
MENREEEKNGTESTNRNVETEQRPLQMPSPLPTITSIESSEERKRVLRTPEKWWFIKRFCCCGLKGACKFIICWDLVFFCLGVLDCLWICSQFGGDINYPGQGLKYLILLRSLLQLLRVIPGIACFCAGTPKPAIKFLFIPRLISVIGVTVLFIITNIVSNVFFGKGDVKALTIAILILILWDFFCQLAIKSYSVQPPKEGELPRLNSDTKSIPYQPIFILAQQPSSTMLIPGNQLAVMQAQNHPQQINPQPNAQQIQQIAQNRSQQINHQPNAQQIQQVAQNPSQQIIPQPNPEQIQQIGQNAPQQIILQPNTQQILVSQQN